jgi:hypothetical protein
MLTLAFHVQPVRASGTIYQHFFNAAKALFVISYLILSLKGGIMGVTFENMSCLLTYAYSLLWQCFSAY